MAARRRGPQHTTTPRATPRRAAPPRGDHNILRAPVERSRDDSGRAAADARLKRPRPGEAARGAADSSAASAASAPRACHRICTCCVGARRQPTAAGVRGGGYLRGGTRARPHFTKPPRARPPALIDACLKDYQDTWVRLVRWLLAALLGQRQPKAARGSQRLLGSRGPASGRTTRLGTTGHRRPAWIGHARAR